MSRPLFPHQIQALAYANRRNHVALFMEMRLGKSLTTIRWAQRRGGTVLVVGPLSVLPGWMDELALENITAVVPLYGLTHTRRNAVLLTHDTRHTQATWFFINYEAVRADPGLLVYPWRTLVLDESTRIRNPKAQITKLMIRRTGHIRNRAILSGLPAPEGPLDYFSQMTFLDGSFLGASNYWEFRNKHFHQVGYDWLPNKGALTAIKQAVHAQAFVLTRGAAKMGSRKVYERRVVPMNADQKRYTKQVTKDFAFENLETQWTTVRLLWLARLAGGFSPDRANPQMISDTKVNELVSLLTGELWGQSVVIWFRFNEELHAVRAALTRAKLTSEWMTGATSVDDRRRIAARFQKGVFPYLLMQEKIGQFGLDLSRASTAIYYSNVYDYEVRAQSEDRIIHPTKKEPLLYIDLITAGSPDRAVIAALQDKSTTARSFMWRLAQELAAEWRQAHGIQGAAAIPVQPHGAGLRARVRYVFPGATIRQP